LAYKSFFKKCALNEFFSAMRMASAIRAALAGLSGRRGGIGEISNRIGAYAGKYLWGRGWA